MSDRNVRLTRRNTRTSGFSRAGGASRNQKCYESRVEFASDIPDEMRQLLFTPETSGGLFAAVPAGKITLAETLFAEAGQPFWVVGNVRESGEWKVKCGV
jgi:selenophosphate synthase